MKFIGAHVKTSGGVQNAPINARKIKATALALFTKNQRRWHANPLSENTIREFKSNLIQAGIQPRHVLVHDSYLINIGHPETEARLKSIQALLDEARRTEQLGLSLLNFHPGSHLRKISLPDCLKYISDGINEIISKTDSCLLVLETTAGQGSNVGYCFEQLAEIIQQVEIKKRIGVCIDTCHIFAAGYDIREKDSYQKTMQSFEESIGFEYLKGVHLNDSKMELGSKRDRHELIGQGQIGLNGFKLLMNDQRFNEIPLILETHAETRWEQEIKMLYQMIKPDQE